MLVRVGGLTALMAFVCAVSGHASALQSPPLGNTWGYDQTSVWVKDGCSGVFVPGQAPDVFDPGSLAPGVTVDSVDYRIFAMDFGVKSAGFRNSREYIVGGNYYWFDSRNLRTNFQWINVTRSPVSSVFGFYVGGQSGNTVSLATSFNF